MFQIKIVSRPTKANIKNKYFTTINRIHNWATNLCTAFNTKLCNLYLRGSIAHGCENSLSDLDIVILVKDCRLENILQFENTIDTFNSLYNLPYWIDVRVFNLNSINSVEPSVNISDPIKDLVKKHLSFDIYANGICLAGTPLNDQTRIFTSPQEFIQNNCYIWGGYINNLVLDMQKQPSFNDYYSLIKKSIRLAAYIRFNTYSSYYGTLDKCYLAAIHDNPEIRAELTTLYKLLKQLNNNQSASINSQNRNALKVVTDYLLKICNRETSPLPKI